MAIFPKVQDPCPYLKDLSSIMDGENCRICHRKVHDLTAMSDAERLALVRSCGGDACVTYRLSARSALAALLVGAALAVPFSAAAEEKDQDGAQVQGEELIVTGGRIGLPHPAQPAQTAPETEMQGPPSAQPSAQPPAAPASGPGSPPDVAGPGGPSRP